MSRRGTHGTFQKYTPVGKYDGPCIIVESSVAMDPTTSFYKNVERSPIVENNIKKRRYNIPVFRLQRELMLCPNYLTIPGGLLLGR